MRIDDTRRLDRNTKEYIRKRSVSLALEGKPIAHIAKEFNVNRTTIYEWVAQYKQGGWEALDSKPIPGTPPKLSDEQQAEIIYMVIAHNPREYGKEQALWTREIISDLVMSTFGISMGVTAVGDMLHRWGVEPQKPLRRAYERDPEEIERWVNEIYPDIRRRGKQMDADIVFLDEMGVRSDSALGRTWGEKGARTIVETPGTRQSINAISAVSYHGAFWFDTYEGKLNAMSFEEELAKLIRYRRRPLFIILDGLPAHRAKSIQEYVQSLDGMLELHFLPGYAPELNPDEYIWNYVKSHHGPSKVPLAQNESLSVRMNTVLNKVKSNPELVKNIIQPIVNTIELSGSIPIV